MTSPVARRIEAWAGETRVNLIRLAAIVAFYGHHLVNVYILRDDPTVAGSYHLAVTALTLAWASAVVVIHFCLARRWLPPALPYAVTAWDIVLVTALLVLTRDPFTALAALYFLVIAAAPLRLSLGVVYAATLGSMAAYAFFLGYVKYGLEVPDGRRLSRPNQIIFLLALGGAGLLAGQMVRQAARLARGYPVVIDEARDAEPCRSE
jgi:hypothetical protein